MSDFKNKLDKQSKDLMGSFSSLVSPLPVKFQTVRAWREHVRDNSNISIACNLTFKTHIKTYDALSQTTKKEFISESYAHAYCVNFAHRINSLIYKNAYKRYGKKLIFHKRGDYV